MLILCQQFQEKNGGTWVDMKVPEVIDHEAGPPSTWRSPLNPPKCKITTAEEWAEILKTHHVVGKFRCVASDGVISLIVVQERREIFYDVEIAREA